MDRRAAQNSVEAEGRLLVERLGGRWTQRGGMCRCPSHADRSPSLSVRPGRKRLLLHCFAGCDTKDILRALATEQLLAPAPAVERERSVADRPDALSAAALRIWSGARSLHGTPAEAYLEGRGLEGGPELRFHSCTPLGPRPLTRHGPALLAAVRDNCGLVGIHRTFLEQRGPHVVAVTKRGLGAFGFGAVRLGGEAHRLGLAEGIETALSASSLFGLPCWATLGTERFSSVALPIGVRQLVLFLDNDAGGRRAERLARAAFSELPIEVRYAPGRGADWNDVLRRSRPAS